MVRHILLKRKVKALTNLTDLTILDHFDDFRRFSTIFDDFRQMLTIFDEIRRFLTIFDDFRQFFDDFRFDVKDLLSPCFLAKIFFYYCYFLPILACKRERGEQESRGAHRSVQFDLIVEILFQAA